MKNIEELKKKKNEIKLLYNSFEYQYTRLHYMYDNVVTKKEELENLAIDINEAQALRLKIEITSIIGMIISLNLPIDEKFSNLFLILTFLIFIINTINYIKGYRYYKSNIDEIDDLEFDMEKIIITAHTIKKEKNNLESLLDNIIKSIEESNFEINLNKTDKDIKDYKLKLEEIKNI